MEGVYMVEMKWDAYYEAEKPYKMTMEDMHERSKARDGYITEEDFLAYLRYRRNDVRFYAPTEMPSDITLFPLGGFALTSGKSGRALCRLMTREDGEPYTDSSYNPIEEKDALWENHWYRAYKLAITPVEFRGCVDKWYVSDFLGAIRDGRIEIWE